MEGVTEVVFQGPARRREQEALCRLVELIDRRDAGLCAHSQLVGEYAAATARTVGLSRERVDRVRLAGLVHDVGKVTLDDAILHKPGPLNEHEWARVREHPEHGAWLAAGAGMQDVSQWILAHHERVDGAGYPHGLQADEIPMEGRILAVVDAYEAMTSDRVYRSSMSHEEACAELRRNAGSQFDPDVVEAFLRSLSHLEAPEAFQQAG